ncbi:MAG: leucyl aminopeptidase [Actinobacteria bacterium]|nr:leucyl aminopeptidase [Actinomycetota bacterium]
MTKVQLIDGAVTTRVLVVGLAHGEGKNPSLHIESGDLVLDRKPLLAALSDLGATGKEDEIIRLPGSSIRLLVFTGLGKAQRKYPHEVLRRAAGAATRALAGNPEVSFAMPVLDLQSVNSIAEGATVAAYSFDNFRGITKSEMKAPVTSITVHTAFANSPEARGISKRASVIGQYTALVRDLVNMPPSHLNPISFVEIIRNSVADAGGEKTGLKLAVLNEKQLRTQGYGGITGVGQGSANPPRLLHISYHPKKAKQKYALVGKGITFDSGGLNLKAGLGMQAIKSDMAGAATVCAAILAIATLKLPIQIDVWAALAENMVSDTATRPGDILTIYGGKTVEVLNPDAEGRLVLADALVKAIEVGNSDGKGLKLNGIIDVATLTGTQVVALGTRTGAVMTNNEELSARFLLAAGESGDSFWPMPLPEELRPSLDSPVADLANIGEPKGGMLVAGLFLREFISGNLPWIHLDIVGPAYNEHAPHGYTPRGGTGMPLRALVRFAENNQH